VLPLLTGGVGLLTVWQERVGKEATAVAKAATAKLERRQAEAESLLGLAMLSSAALPTYLAVSSTAAGVSCLGFLDVLSPSLSWACGPPILFLNSFALLLTLVRYRQIQRYVAGAARVVQADVPKEQIPWFQRLLLLLLLPALTFLIPVSMPRRIAAAAALLAAESGFVMASANRQIAMGEFYAARADRVCSRTEAWAQISSTVARGLPVTTALALVNTLIATSLAAVQVPFSGVFPILGVVYCVRAVQRGTEARELAAITTQECASYQSFGPFPPPYQEQHYNEERDQPVSTSKPAKRRLALASVLKELIAQGQTISIRSMLFKMGRVFVRLCGEDRLDQQDSPTEDVKVVRSVQADLEELRITVRSNEKNWVRTGTFVGLVAAAAICSPFLLSAEVAGVILPVAGTSLTLFVVVAEADARSAVSQAKVHAAKLKEQSSTMEESVTSSQLWKSYLFSLVGISEAIAVFSLVLAHPSAFGRSWAFFSEGIYLLLIVAQTGVAYVSAMRLLQVQRWADNVLRIRGNSFSVERMRSTKETSPQLIREGKGRLPVSRRQRRFVTLAAILPSIFFAAFPLSMSWSHRAVQSTAAGALAVAIILFYAERATWQAEQTQSSYQRASALSDAFSNRAEEQGALLPFNSAATIAVAGVITFVTEVNPYTAAALTILQALSWVIASRKSVATKFESAAGLQVRSQFVQPGSIAEGGTLGRRLKSLFIR